MRNERFIDPIDLEEDVAVGLKLPLSTINGRLFPLSYTTEEQGLSNFKNLILTNVGERVMQPTYGVDIYRYLFENNVNLGEIIKEKILTATNVWLPFVIINKIDVKDDIDNHIIEINLIIQIGTFGSLQPISFKLTETERTVNG